MSSPFVAGTLQSSKFPGSGNAAPGDPVDRLAEVCQLILQKAKMLPSSGREKALEEFAFLLDPEAWDPEDNLPDMTSVERFLEWMGSPQFYPFSSLGIGNDGSVLLAKIP